MVKRVANAATYFGYEDRIWRMTEAGWEHVPPPPMPPTLGGAARRSSAFVGRLLWHCGRRSPNDHHSESEGYS